MLCGPLGSSVAAWASIRISYSAVQYLMTTERNKIFVPNKGWFFE